MAHRLKKMLGTYPAGQTGVYWPVSQGFPVVHSRKTGIFAGTLGTPSRPGGLQIFL